MAHGYDGDDSVDQMGGGIRHAPSAARGAEGPALTRERDHSIVAAVVATDADETVGKNAALEVGPELALDEARDFALAALSCVQK